MMVNKEMIFNKLKNLFIILKLKKNLMMNLILIKEKNQEKEILELFENSKVNKPRVNKNMQLNVLKHNKDKWILVKFKQLKKYKLTKINLHFNIMNFIFEIMLK